MTQVATPSNETAPSPRDALFYRRSWRDSLASAQTAPWKRGLYRAIRPALSYRARRFLTPATLAELRPDLVLFRRGMPLVSRRAWGATGTPLRGATLLVQGTGTGWDVVPWASLRPSRIIATDLCEFGDSWEEIARHCRDHHGVDVEFRAAPLEDHSFLADGAIDLCASDAVLEHCRDLDGVLRESRRVLREGGALYAAYGPLWYAPGGDHFSGRGGLSHAYDHVRLDPPDYRAYFERHRHAEEDFQSGGRYVELDLFSRLTSRGYLAAFDRAGFRREGLVLELCPDAIAFERRHPDLHRPLVERIRGAANPDDLRIKANLIRLRRA